MAAATDEHREDGTIAVTYDRQVDALVVRLREIPEVDRTEDAGGGRHVHYSGDEPVGVEFRDVRRGIRIDGLPESLAALATVGAALAAVARLLPDRTVGMPVVDQADTVEDETAYLLRSPRNAARLRAAYDRAMRGEGEPMDVVALRREVGLAEG